MKGGFGFSAKIKNNGQYDITDINWSINFEGDMILFGKNKNGKINLPAGSETLLKSGLIIGLGETIITTIIQDEVGKISKGFIIGPIIINVT